jgi:hypothetical protein
MKCPLHGDTTFRVIDELVIPDNVAEIMAVPAATPVAEPFANIVEILVLEQIQVT